MAKRILDEFNDVVAGCQKVLEALPEDRLQWRPHEKSFTAAALATHIGSIPKWTASTLATSGFDFAAPGEDPPPRIAPMETLTEILENLESSADEARSALRGADDGVFDEEWSLLQAGRALFTLPKRVVIRRFVLDHMIHHRAQLGVYLRLLGAKVPQTMGPTADFPEM